MGWRTGGSPALMDREDGLYQAIAPRALWMDGVFLLFLATVTAYVLLRVPQLRAAVLVATGLAAARTGWDLWRRRRWGAGGQPLVRLHAGQLMLALPGHIAPRAHTVAVQSLRRVRVEGPPYQRLFVLETADGRSKRLIPGFRGETESRVIDALRRVLPAQVVFEQVEPTHFFQRVRGE